MSDNILKIIYTNRYKNKEFDEHNYVKNILTYFLEWQKIEQSSEYKRLLWQDKDKKRLEYDCDVYYYKYFEKLSDEEALHGDTMVSFWTPYKLALYQKTGWSYSKTVKSLELLIMKIDSGDPNYLEVNKKFESFAKIYYTKGNFILLPNRKMNNERNKFCEDRIDETIYQCFNGGMLSHNFTDDTKLHNWITKQNLQMLFKEKNIKCENIITFIKPTKFAAFYMSLNQIYNYIDKAVEIIKSRNDS